MLAKVFSQLPWLFLVPLAILLGLAPFHPEPHLVEKLRLLSNGQLTNFLDIFDLLFHSAPLVLIFGKLMFGRQKKDSR